MSVFKIRTGLRINCPFVVLFFILHLAAAFMHRIKQPNTLSFLAIVSRFVKRSLCVGIGLVLVKLINICRTWPISVISISAVTHSSR
jgi:hypothetical protein